MDEVGERSPWDELAANDLPDKHVLVGLTFERPNGKAIAEVQLHGEIARYRRVLLAAA